MSSVPRLSLDGPTAQIETASFAAAAFGDVWLLYQHVPIINDDHWRRYVEFLKGLGQMHGVIVTGTAGTTLTRPQRQEIGELQIQMSKPRLAILTNSYATRATLPMLTLVGVRARGFKREELPAALSWLGRDALRSGAEAFVSRVGLPSPGGDAVASPL